MTNENPALLIVESAIYLLTQMTIQENVSLLEQHSKAIDRLKIKDTTGGENVCIALPVLVLLSFCSPFNYK